MTEALGVADQGGQMTEAIISVRGLTRRYPGLIAVDNVDLDIPAGSIFGLIGPNGAGKTTVLSMLASILTPTSGTVRIKGLDPITQTREYRRNFGYMPDVMGVVGSLTADEYLDFFAAAYEVPASDRPGLVEGLLQLVDLDEKRGAMVDSLSRGMKQRLSLARALVHDPDVLLLDEPASGLDPRARIDLRHLLEELRNMGKTVVISSHILAELEDMCTEVAIMDHGRLLASGPVDTIRGHMSRDRMIRIRLTDGTVQEHPVADDADQAALLRRLIVEENLEILEFTVARALEDVFLHVTKGAEQ